MRERYLGWVLLLFSCISIIALLTLIQSLQKTRDDYSTRTPFVVNILLQSDYAIDQYKDALYNLQSSINTADLKNSVAIQNEDNVRFHFDILWSSLKDFTLQFPDEYDPSALAGTVEKNIDTFLTDHEPLMSPTYSLTQQDINKLIYRTNNIADDIRQLGRGYYFTSVRNADAGKEQISQILNNIRFFIASLLITGGCAIGLLIYNNRRTTKLFNEARNARTELAVTVDELRSGKQEQKAKDTFIAAASHDLRQPLHALGIFLNSLSNKVNSDGQKALAGAQTCTEDLNRLFNSLLDLSRLDAGFVTVENEDFNLRKALNKLHAELSPKANGYGIHMNIVFEGSCSFAHSDPVLIERIVRNLIENAIVHSQATTIKLSYDCLPEGCKIAISDNGCGIPKNEHEAIFSEYYQLQNPERDRSKGLGIGLSIVKRLTTLLNVNLEIISDENTGTTFKILVPKSTVQTLPLYAAEPTAPIADFSYLAGTVIVVIDDDRHIREAMHMMLTKHGAIPICGETSDEVLEALAEEQLAPDFIIADYRLRNHLTGDVVITHLRAAIEAAIPALIITGDTSPDRMASLKESGFDILHKPIEAEPLFDTVINILKRESATDADNLPSAM